MKSMHEIIETCYNGSNNFYVRKNSMNSKQTSDGLAKLAAQILKNDQSSKIAKSLAASALSQSNTKKETGANMEKTASDVLKSNKYSDETKSLAASLVSQSNKERKHN